MLYQSHLFSAASGKLSGLVASHNKGGPYVRAYAVPTDPNTAEQGICRDAWSALSTYWKSTMSATNRARWANLASSVKLPNRLGIERTIGGRPLFFRQNFHRAQGQIFNADAVSPIAAPPATIANDFGPIPATTVQTAANSVVRFTWPSTPPWSGDTTGMLLIYASALVTTQINHYFGPWTLVSAIAPPDWSNPSDIQMASGFTLNAGKRMFHRMIFTW